MLALRVKAKGRWYEVRHGTLALDLHGQGDDALFRSLDSGPSRIGEVLGFPGTLGDSPVPLDVDVADREPQLRAGDQDTSQQAAPLLAGDAQTHRRPLLPGQALDQAREHEHDDEVDDGGRNGEYRQAGAAGHAQRGREPHGRRVVSPRSMSRLMKMRTIRTCNLPRNPRAAGPGPLLPAAIEKGDVVSTARRRGNLMRADEACSTRDQQMHRLQGV